MELHVVNETARLREVVLGMPWANGPVPSLSETFDSKSYESVLNGTYPAEQDIVAEMSAFEAVLTASAPTSCTSSAPGSSCRSR